MSKCLSFLLSGALALGLSAEVAASPVAQTRFAPDAGKNSTELLRRTADGDRHEASLAGAVRKVATAEQRVFTHPAPNTAVRPTNTGAAKAPMSRVSATLNVYGTIIFENTWTNYDNLGLYKLPVSNGGAFTSLFSTPNPVYSFYGDEGKYYCMYEVAYGSWVMGYDLYVYDTETNSQIGVIEFNDEPLKATDVAYDPDSGRVYGYFSGDYYGEEYHHWGYLDLNSKSVVKIADCDTPLRGVAIDKFGQAYGVGIDRNLYKINKTTGAFETIGATGCPSLYYATSAAFNDKDGTILLTYCNLEGSGLCEIDPTTAASSVIVEFEHEEEVIGLFVPAQAPDKAPTTPLFSASCTDGSMQADFTITMPTTLYDGTDASGEQMGYKIYANGNEILNGKATAGSEVNTSATMTESGVYTFVAVATNDSGESNQAKTSCYIGKGTPAATGNVVLSYSGNSFLLTWDAVTASADGGYINPADVRYSVVDSEGNTVASDITECSWTTTQAIPDDFTGYSFGVITCYDAKTSKAAMSNTIYLGHYNAPLSMSMTDESIFGQHTVIDVNKDGKTWKFKSGKGAVYSYSSTNAGDDWLISPAIYVEGGKAYDFNAVAHAYSDKYPETIEIKMGTSPEPEAMTTVLVDPTTLGGSNLSMPAHIIPAASGEYYIGFHAITEAGQWDLTLVSYCISEPYGATAPDAVRDLNVTPDFDGELKATISFTAASTTVTNADYTGNMKFVVLRNGEKVKELTGAKGSAQTITDNVPEAGRYTYTVEAYNLEGDLGRTASASAFVGPNVPNPPATVKAVETPGKHGELTLSWNHATTDLDGRELNPAHLSYMVYYYDYSAEKWVKAISEPTTELSCTFSVQEETAPQNFVSIGVQTVNHDVYGDEMKIDLVVVGPAYSIPMSITKIDDFQQYIIGVDNWDGCEFGMKADGEMSAVVSQDGDGQFFYGERVSSSAELGTGKGRGDFIFGKYSLEGATHPVFSMYTWKITETDQTKLEILINCEGEETVAGTIDYQNDTHNQWTKKVINLEAFAGKEIQPIIRYTSNGLVYCFFDNIKIVDMPDYDLGAVSVTAPKKVTAGTDFDVDVIVENVGRLATGAFTVELYGNGTLVDIKNAEGIAANDKTTVTFTRNINMAGDKTVEFSARVLYNDDADLSNNITSKNATVTREDSFLPTIANLNGEFSNDGILVSWDAITDDNIPFDPYVESFENAEAFTKEYPGWTFIDRDDCPSGNLGNINVPNHQGNVDHESFIVFDGTHDNFAMTSYAKEYLAADGKQYLGSIYSIGESATDLVPSDDWAISPLLKGCSQTVSFKGKNCSINYSELIQVWYTTTESVNPEDFVQLTSFNNPGANYRLVRTDGWGEFSFTLPEGALRFAIRVVSNDGMMFMLDEVEYLAADAVKGLEHTGYNIYCDGVLLNSEPVKTNSYTFGEIENDKTYTFHVSAVYNRGESEANSITVVTTGLDNLNAVAKVYVENRQIVVADAADKKVQVIAADGKMLYSAEGDARVNVSGGIYLVKVGNRITKLIVR